MCYRLDTATEEGSECKLGHNCRWLSQVCLENYYCHISAIVLSEVNIQSFYFLLSFIAENVNTTGMFMSIYP